MRHFIIFISFFCWTGCNNDNNSKTIQSSYDFKGFDIDILKLNIDQNKFSYILDTLDKPMDTYEGLFYSKDFTNIFENSSFYLNNVIKYLSNTSNSISKKTIAIMSMQKKGFQKNLNFLFACDYLYKKGAIDEQMLFDVIFPRLDLTNADILKNYKNEQVRQVLNDIRTNSKSTKQFKETIDDILSGKTYKEHKTFLEGQYNIEI